MFTSAQAAELAATITNAIDAAEAAVAAGTIKAATGDLALEHKAKAAAWAERTNLTGWCAQAGQLDWRAGFLLHKPTTGRATRRLYALSQARLGQKVNALYTAALDAAYTPRKIARVALDRPPFVAETVPVHGYTSAARFVVHCTEDNLPLSNLFRYFRGTADGLGVQYAIDAAGVLAIAAGPHDRCYHVASHNSECVGVELTGYDGTDWTKRTAQLEMLAWLMAWHCRDLSVPLVQCANERRVWTRPRGVLQHRWCPDNDHSDCGSRFPFATVLARAADFTAHGVPGDVVERRRAARKAYRPGVVVRSAG